MGTEEDRASATAPALNELDCGPAPVRSRGPVRAVTVNQRQYCPCCVESDEDGDHGEGEVSYDAVDGEEECD